MHKSSILLDIYLLCPVNPISYLHLYYVYSQLYHTSTDVCSRDVCPTQRLFYTTFVLHDVYLTTVKSATFVLHNVCPTELKRRRLSYKTKKCDVCPTMNKKCNLSYKFSYAKFVLQRNYVIYTILHLNSTTIKEKYLYLNKDKFALSICC